VSIEIADKESVAFGPPPLETYRRERESGGRALAVIGIGWLRFVGSLKLYVSFAKEPYKRDYILQKRPVILRSLLIVANPYQEIGERVLAEIGMGWLRLVGCLKI